MVSTRHTCLACADMAQAIVVSPYDIDQGLLRDHGMGRGGLIFRRHGTGHSGWNLAGSLISADDLLLKMGEGDIDKQDN